MVGLVIVSHSRALADALIELVKQVTGKDIPLAAAAGVGDNRQEFGTDATHIVEAIESVYSADGVVVLMDLGSAVLSADTALELLAEEMRPGVRFCDAPLVEGAIAAGVQISLGSDFEAVCREARQALVPKSRQISADDVGGPAASTGDNQAAVSESWQEIFITVDTPHGLHARPAARFVQTACAFNADIRVHKPSAPQTSVAANSLSSLATLDVVQGDQIVVSARGPEAAAALNALKLLVVEQLAEITDTILPTPSKTLSDQGAISAIAVSEGIAIGPLFQYQALPPEIPDQKIQAPESEWTRLQQALAATRSAIEQRRRQFAASLGQSEAAIFEAHLLMLQDPVLLEQAREQIFKKRNNAAAAWHQCFSATAANYRSLSDPYQQQRAADVMDVGNQVLFALMGETNPPARRLPKPVILAAHQLNPTQTAQLAVDQVLALITVAGGQTAHSAILARGLGIPAVTGADPSVLNLPAGTPLAIDGFNGLFWINPSPAVVEKLQERRADWLARRETLRHSCRQPAITRDGRRVIVAANLGTVAEAQVAVASGAEAVGLLRTEFLYLTRHSPPDEDEQVNTLRHIGAAMGNRPICVRTLDVGGDKPLPYIKHALEANPFLGLRAIRLSLNYPDLFSVQLRAILRAAAEFELRLMLPMISTMEEVNQALQLLEKARRELQQANIAHRWPIQTGMMIETPAAALLCAAFAKQLDFFSIGTNDLIQYTLAAERGNPQLAAYADGFHPAVLHLIHRVVEAANRNGKPVAVCGEMASDAEAVPVLVGMGVHELSVNPDAVGRVKAIIREMDHTAASALADEILQMESGPAARRLASRLVS